MKKILLIISFLILGGVIGYLFIYPYDYLVTMEARANKGTINQIIKLWNTSLDSTQIEAGEDLEQLTQTLHFGDSTHIYNWKISSVNDSISKIKVFAKDSAFSLNNKLKVPFMDTDFEKRTKKNLKNFADLLANHLENIKVRIVGEGHLDSTHYAYVHNKTTQFGKAGGMMLDFPLLDPFLMNNGVELNGKPFIEILEWDMENDSLEFNFCYPIIRNDSLPQHPDLKYGFREPVKALKAVYNGNYITSDRAWYELLDHAEKNGIKVTGLPVEVFYNNPNIGVEELSWKAEVFMPLKD
ncbi:AraC family transcriptional regulator [Muriicola soli]|uniref:AraC family transcriptional regulator n=1 Tax=Muriicola soli TaxID=2507538 RepID=A0A411EBM4_9FLAO|nr:AraC family transcriptional regulator [Muriicola soli]QBA65069.1 AraC family transcriptional regulator [Muriicola soli]